MQEKPFDWIRGYHVGGKSLLWARQTQRWSAYDFAGPARDGFATLLADRDRRLAMGQAGHRRARANYDWATVVRSYQDLFSDLEKARRKATPQPIRAAVNPWRRNPFDLFRGYSSRIMQKGMRLRATPRAEPIVAGVPGVDQMALDLAQLRGRTPCDTPKTRALLRQIVAAGAAGVAYEELLRPEIGEPVAMICFDLGWLMKLGLVELAG